MSRILLNSDVGEGHEDEQIMPYIDLCNIACGGHTGTAETIRRTVELAAKNNVLIGAHPSFPDRENFGRKVIDMNLSELLESILSQIGLVERVCQINGQALHHIKMHGALYSEFCTSADLSTFLLKSIKKEHPNVSIVGMANSVCARSAFKEDIRFLSEAFGDRNYFNSGQLQNRAEENALLTSKPDVSLHVVRLTQGILLDLQGKSHNIKADTICMHSDTPNATELIRIVSTIINPDE